MPVISELLWAIAWLAVFGVVVILAGFGIARAVRGRMRREHDEAQGFTLGQIVRLRRSGQLNEVEYELMRNAALGRLALQPDFTLQALREMRARAEITEAEYEVVRGVLVARLKAETGGAQARD